MRLQFHHDTQVESLIVRCPLEDYQALYTYQRKYPKAEIDAVLDGWDDLNRLIVGKSFHLEDRNTINLLRFLNGQARYLTEREQKKFERLLPTVHTLEEAVEGICNLDCFQFCADGSLEKRKAFSYHYQSNGSLPPIGRTAEHTVKAFFRKKEEACWLFFPMTEEKETHIKKLLGISDWAGEWAELVSLEPALLGAYLPNAGHSIETIKQLADILQQPELKQVKVQECCAAALLVQQPQNLKEACWVLERKDQYTLSQEQAPGCVQTKFGYLNLNGEAPLHPLETELVTSWIYGRVCAEYNSGHFHGDDMVFLRWGDPTLMQFEDEIREQIAKEILPEEAERGLAVYLHNELLKEKVYQISPDVAIENGALWSKTKVESFGPLSIAEQEAIKAYLQGQFSDGWGEGFSQREISIGEGERLFVHFYASEMDEENLLYTEEEFEQQLEQQEVELRL